MVLVGVELSLMVMVSLIVGLKDVVVVRNK